ncbi:uncharacterized protein LOC122009528 [Zingiber officinale]|nr:uncharacterized protein LOC122009528 [Zingiber officinale]
MVKERVITVEYLEPSMSRELVGKFPEHSAFDFEYSQSGIWSPLLPRGHHAPVPLLCLHARKKFLSGSPVTLRKVKAKLSKKKKKKKKQSAIGKNLEFTPIPSPKLGWKRVLRAAAKRFKIHGKSPLPMVLPTL